MKHVKNITEGNIYKNYFLYGAPLLLSAILISLYSTIDASIAGKFIGEYANGAISSTSAYDILFNLFFNGFSSGFSVYIAQLFGKGEYATIKRDTVNMTVLVAVAAVAVSVVSISLRNPILDYLNIDDALRTDAETYFVIYTASYAFAFVNMILMRVLYALGITSFSLYVSLSSAVINLGGNILAVVVFKAGVAGIALSTVISILAATVIYSVMIVKAFKDLKCEKIPFKFDISCFKNSMKYTLPAAFQKFAYSATDIFVAPAVNALGPDATTGFSVMTKMYGICGQSFWSMCNAVDCHTAQSVGIGDGKKMRRGLLAGLWTNLAVLTPVILSFIVFAEPIASIYFPDGYNGLAFEYAVRFFKVYGLSLYIAMTAHLFHSYIRSIGKFTMVFWATLVDSIIYVVLTVVLVPKIGIDGAYIGRVLSWLVDGVICIIVYFIFYHNDACVRKIIAAAHKKKESIE